MSFGRLHCIGLGLAVGVLAACSNDDPIPPLGGETGSVDEEPLPGGDDCEANWYAVD